MIGINIKLKKAQKNEWMRVRRWLIGRAKHSGRSLLQETFAVLAGACDDEIGRKEKPPITAERLG